MGSSSSEWVDEVRFGMKPPPRMVTWLVANYAKLHCDKMHCASHFFKVCKTSSTACMCSTNDCWVLSCYYDNLWNMNTTALGAD